MIERSLAIANRPHPDVPNPGGSVADDLMRGLVVNYFDFVWRVLRRLGVPEFVAEDAAQDVFIIADRKTRETWPDNEKSYLFAIAIRVASDKRQAEKRRHDMLDTDDWSRIADTAPGPDVILDARRARSVADEIVQSIPFEPRIVFVLFELESMTMLEIAEMLDIPSVASRARAVSPRCSKI
jgi:RNA polymerase sigma-70 factor (ECF subfamily)